MPMPIEMTTKGQSGTDHPLVGADVLDHKNVPPEFCQMTQPDDMNT